MTTLINWSFPNCCWEDMKCFLNSQKYNYKCIKAQNYVTVTKNPDLLHQKFGGFQEDFKIFNSIRDTKGTSLNT